MSETKTCKKCGVEKSLNDMRSYKKKYPYAFSISVRDINGYEEQWINPNYRGV